MCCGFLALQSSMPTLVADWKLLCMEQYAGEVASWWHEIPLQLLYILHGNLAVYWSINCFILQCSFFPTCSLTSPKPEIAECTSVCIYSFPDTGYISSAASVTLVTVDACYPNWEQIVDSKMAWFLPLPHSEFGIWFFSPHRHSWLHTRITQNKCWTWYINQSQYTHILGGKWGGVKFQ